MDELWELGWTESGCTERNLSGWTESGCTERNLSALTGERWHMRQSE